MGTPVKADEKPRSIRDCAICQVVRVEKTRVCEDCMNLYKDQQNEPWFIFALEESEKTNNIIRIARKKERSLDAVYYDQEGV